MDAFELSSVERPQDLLAGLLTESPTRYPGRAKVLNPTEEIINRLLGVPGVRQLGQDWLVPHNLLLLGARPGTLFEYAPDPTEAAPSGLKLKDYQRRAVAFLRLVDRESAGAILAAEPGLGKTLTALQALWLDGYLHRPGLVIGPLGARGTWCSKTGDPKRHYGRSVIPIDGTDADYRIFKSAPPNSWFFIHYDILKPWQSTIFSDLKPASLIIDEIHYCMNSDGTRWEATFGVAGASAIERRYGLTGTPIPKTRLDLFGQLAVVQPHQWGEKFYDYGIRHCLSAGTMVTLGDYSAIPIEQVRIGDLVIGYEKTDEGIYRTVRTEVLDLHCRAAAVWRLVLSDGSILLTTEDHQWFYNNGGITYAPIREQAAPKKARIRRMFRWHARLEPSPAQSDGYVDGWLRGVIDGDGHVRRAKVSPYIKERWGGDWTYSVTVTQAYKNMDVLNRLRQFAERKRWRTRQRSHSIDTLTVSLAAQRATRGNGSAKTCYEFATTATGTPEPTEFWRGWLSGMYDAEGHGNTISQSAKVNSRKHALIGQALLAFGFDAIPLLETRYSYSTGWRFRGGIEELLRFRQLFDPCMTYKLDTELLTGMRTEHPEVVSFQPTGEIRRMYNIATGTGNYFADGIATKNCAGRRETTEGNTEGKSWWVFEGHSNTAELRARLAGVYLRFTKADVPGELPGLERHRIEVELPPDVRKEYDQARNNVLKWQASKGKRQAPETFLVGGTEYTLQPDDPKATQLVTVSALKSILDRGKVPQALRVIKELAAKHERIVVFTWRRESAKEICRELRLAQQQTPTVIPEIFGPIDGTDKWEKRIEEARAFAKSPWAVFVATRGSVGIAINDLSCADACLQITSDWNPDGNLQAESRLHREGATAPVIHSYYMLASKTLDDRVLELLRNKADEAKSLVSTDSGGLHLVADLDPTYGDESRWSMDEICAMLAQVEDNS